MENDNETYDVTRGLAVSAAAQLLGGTRMGAPVDAIERDLVRLTDGIHHFVEQGAWPEGFGIPVDARIPVADEETRASIRERTLDHFDERSAAKDLAAYGIPLDEPESAEDPALDGPPVEDDLAGTE